MRHSCIHQKRLISAGLPFDTSIVLSSDENIRMMLFGFKQQLKGYSISAAVIEPSSLNIAGKDTSQMMKFTRRWRTSHPFSLVRQVSFSFFVFILNSLQVCGKQFERRRRWCLDQHMLSHETERKFNCDICGKFFRNSSYLKTHRKACLGVKVHNFIIP